MSTHDTDLPRPGSPGETSPARGTSPAEPAPAPRRPRKRKWLRRSLWTLGILFVLLLLTVALAPTLISTGPGTNLAESLAGRFVNGRVQLSDLSVGWFSGTKLSHAVVDDPEGKRVLEIADLDTDLTLLEVLRRHFDLGEASVRVDVPIVTIDDQGRTSIDRVFGLDEPSDESEERTDLPTLLGSLALDGDATFQYVGKPDVPGQPSDDGPPVNVNFTGTKLTFGRGQSLQHVIPLALRVDGQEAGTITADGQVALDSLSADRPAIREDVRIERLQLAAISTLAAAFGMESYALEGVLDGTVNIDAQQNQLAAQITGQDIQLNQRDAAERGFQTSLLELTASGSFTEQALPPDQHVTTSDGQTLTTRRIVNLDELRLVTDAETLTAAVEIDLLQVQADALANWPTLARQVRLDFQSDYATAHGAGENLGSFTLTASADARQLKQRFGGALGLETIDPAGRIEISLKTAQELSAQGPAVVATYDVRASELVLERRNDAQLAIARQPAQEATPPVPPLHLKTASLAGQVVLPRPGEQTPMGISRATAVLAATDREGQPLFQGQLDVADVVAETGSIGELAIQDLTAPDYARLQRTLAGWVDLPETEQPLQPLTVNAVARFDGTAKSATLTQPLRVSLGEDELLNVNAAATQQGEAAWRIDSFEAVVHVPVLDRLATAIGQPLSGEAPAEGRIVARVPKRQTLSFESADPAGTLTGMAEVDMTEARARGFEFSGAVPVTFEGGRAAVPEDATPLSANGGEVRLAGTTLQKVGENWTLRLPEGQILQNVSLNPVLTEALGKYVNPVFVKPEHAAGFFDLAVSGTDAINLADPLGPGSAISVDFSVRELEINNDVIAGFADAAVGDFVGSLRSQLSGVAALDPGLRQKLESFSLSEEVKEDIASIRGNITGARVDLRDGVANTQITFNVADPRKAEGEEGADQLFPLSFAGGVNTETFATDLDVVIPRELVEKWAGENPGDLVKWFGERPFAKLIPDGVTLGVDGTTYVPVPDVAELSRTLVPQIARAAVQGGAENLLRRGIDDLLNRGGK